MSYIKIAYTRLYYLAANIYLAPQTLSLPPSLKNKKNIFLYFDYEREFGGHKTQITNKEVEYILGMLANHKIPTTWFTVGRIFEHYPESILSIIQKGHEIGSHTFGHTPPLHASYRSLKNDFACFNSCQKRLGGKISGFHAPNGKWSFGAVKLMLKNDFLYDVVSASKNKQIRVQKTHVNNKSLIRFNTVGDDWKLFENCSDKQKAFKHFVRLYNRIKHDELAGIGFHPWVLFSNINILSGFELFVDYLKNQPNTYFDTAHGFASVFRSYYHL